MNTRPSIPAISVIYAGKGTSTATNEQGMRPMQTRAWQKRGEQYLLIKSPPASGKSRALMFIALDKLHKQNIKQAIIVVPEKVIGASFADQPLRKFGFWADWTVPPKRNLCNAPGEEGGSGKVNAVKEFLESDDSPDSDDKILICTHATFRFAVDRFGVEIFDDRLIAIDEFHHVSANPDNKLGAHLGAFIARDRAHIIAMTGSYFRGDAVAVLAPQDEAKFATVTYTYYEQLNGYQHLKRLDIGYYFYSGAYTESILQTLDPNEKTLIHIPNVKSRESTNDKLRETEHILSQLGDWQGTDEDTGFQLVRHASGRILRVADLVDDDPNKRERVAAALKDPTQKDNRDHIDIIIALGMAKEGFDWIWCQHTLTVGYRSSLTEIVQIIGRTTRDAPGKTSARFTNLIAEPDASEQTVTEAINDTLKAIAASLLMEQVLAPRFIFTPKHPDTPATPDATFDPDAPLQPGATDLSSVTLNEDPSVFDARTGELTIQVKNFDKLARFASPQTERIYQDDLNEIIHDFVADKTTLEQGIFNPDVVPEDLTQIRMGKIIQTRYPGWDETDQEAARQRAVAALHTIQQTKAQLLESAAAAAATTDAADADPTGDQSSPNTALIQGVRKIAMDVRELDIDLIDRINPFSTAYAILAKSMDEKNLKHLQTIISAKKHHISLEDARELTRRAVQFKRERGHNPSITSPDPWERRMAEGITALANFTKTHPTPTDQQGDQQ